VALYACDGSVDEAKVRQQMTAVAESVVAVVATAEVFCASQPGGKACGMTLVDIEATAEATAAAFASAIVNATVCNDVCDISEKVMTQAFKKAWATAIASAYAEACSYEGLLLTRALILTYSFKWDKTPSRRCMANGLFWHCTT
jgi:hypothetical protein